MQSPGESSILPSCKVLLCTRQYADLGTLLVLLVNWCRWARMWHSMAPKLFQQLRSGWLLATCGRCCVMRRCKTWAQAGIEVNSACACQVIIELSRQPHWATKVLQHSESGMPVPAFFCKLHRCRFWAQPGIVSLWYSPQTTHMAPLQVGLANLSAPALVAALDHQAACSLLAARWTAEL